MAPLIMKTRFAILFVAASLVATACSAAGSQAGEIPPSPSSTAATPTTPASTTSSPEGLVPDTTAAPSPATSDGVPVSPLASQVEPLGSAIYDPSDHIDDSPAPTSISIARLDVDGAPIVGVGVEENGDMELPDAEAVGWYRFNAKPGQEGSSVLAAHINYNGVNGVFRHLTKVKIGDRVVVGFEDGSRSEFEIVEVAQYDKQQLPIERIFAKTGGPVLTLITCGGDFNRSVRSYDDNFVAYAVPIDA